MTKGSYGLSHSLDGIKGNGGTTNEAYQWITEDTEADHHNHYGGLDNKGFQKEPWDGEAGKQQKTPPAEDETQRQQWDRPIEFLLSCIAMSVGLGNVWRFPTTAYENGGGAFLIPYLIVLTFIGRPLYFLELFLGQFSSCGSVKVWRMMPAAKGVGYGQMLATWSVVTYYTTLMALCVFYFIMSFNAVLPWSVCSGDWATEDCVDSSGNFTYSNNSQSSSEQYFNNYVLKIKDDITGGIGYPEWRLTLCLLFSWLVLFLVLAKGVKSSGKAAYFMALFPYVVLFTLLIRGATLPGAGKGMLYFITPVWEKLLDPNVWYAACTQSFYSLSVGFGAIITFSSYNRFDQNVYRDAWIISIVDTFTSILAGLTIFSILGNLAYEMDTDIENVVRGGSGLAFISYPDALAKFTWAPQLFAVLFFLMLFTLGAGSVAGLSGNIITVLCDKFPQIKKIWATLGVVSAGFLFGLVYTTPGGQWILDLVDFFGGGFIIYVLVIVETIAAVHLYGPRNLLREIKFMLGIDLGIYWKFCWFFFIPIALTGILVYSLVDFKLPVYAGVAYPQAAYICGWLLAAVALVLVPIFYIEVFLKTKGDTFMKRVKETFQPKATWGPSRTSDRQRWEEMKLKQSEEAQIATQQ